MPPARFSGEGAAPWGLATTLSSGWSLKRDRVPMAASR